MPRARAQVESQQTRRRGTGRLACAALVVAGATLAVATLAGAKEGDAVTKARYFDSPAKAVETITTLLNEKRFQELAAYYDLTGTDIERSQLESGAFFIRKKRPPVAHPAGFWRYKHPFAPGFRYHGHSPAKTPGDFVVEVMVEIEQGAGAPVQRGFSRFLMRRSKAGWQVLPGKAPAAAPGPLAPPRLLPPAGLPPVDGPGGSRPPVGYPHGSPFPPGGEPSLTHTVRVFWTTAGGLETDITVTAPGSRPVQIDCSRSSGDGPRSVLAQIGPACDLHLRFRKDAPKTREPGVTYLKEAGSGTLEVRVYGFKRTDFDAPPVVHARYLLDGRLVGETKVDAAPVPAKLKTAPGGR